MNECHGENFGLKIALFYKKGHFWPEGRGAHPLHPPPRSAHELQYLHSYSQKLICTN
jgi:hypothetical protein